MKILIAVDDSPLSEVAAAEAAALFPDPATEFFVLCVAEDPPPWVMDPLGLAMPSATGQAIYTFGVRSRRQAVSSVEGVADALPDANPLIAQGDAAVEICRAAEQVDADIIVVGGVEKRLLQRLIDPPVADDVIHGTRRPVLVVHGPDRT